MDKNTNKKSNKPLIIILSVVCLLLSCAVVFLLISPTLDLKNNDTKDDKHVSTVVSKIHTNSNDFISHIEDVTRIDIPDSYSTTYQVKGLKGESFEFKVNQTHKTIDYSVDLYFKNATEEELENLENMLAEDKRFKSSLGDMKKIVDIDGGEVLSEYKLVYVMDTKKFNTLPDKSGEYRIITIYYDTDLQVLEIKEYNNYYYKAENISQ